MCSDAPKALWTAFCFSLCSKHPFQQDPGAEPVRLVPHRARPPHQGMELLQSALNTGRFEGSHQVLSSAWWWLRWPPRPMSVAFITASVHESSNCRLREGNLFWQHFKQQRAQRGGFLNLSREYFLLLVKAERCIP